MGEIEDITKIAQGFFEKSAAGHDWYHVERVHKMAVRIGRAEGADMSVLEPAALLHDIARKKEDEGVVECHAVEGARMAREILKERGYPQEKIEKVAHSIDVHRYKKQVKPNLLEAKILQDADRLDALGAVAIGRIFTYGGAHGRPAYDPAIKPAEKYESKALTSFNHFYEKILKITPETFNTETARKIAKDRYAFTKSYVERFLKEWNGEI